MAAKAHWRKPVEEEDHTWSHYLDDDDTDQPLAKVHATLCDSVCFVHIPHDSKRSVQGSKIMKLDDAKEYTELQVATQVGTPMTVA